MVAVVTRGPVSGQQPWQPGDPGRFRRAYESGAREVAGAVAADAATLPPLPVR
jgi:hypothetical protein